MREIKFRGFIKDENKMIYPDSTNEYCVLGSNEGGYDLAEGYDTFGVDAILMQFTGLTDCNGVGIYEGDITEDERTHSRYIVEYDEEFARYILVWTSNDERFETFENICGNDLKIIGNIYEMKEDGNEISEDKIELIALYLDYHSTKHNFQFAEAIDKRTGRVAVTNNGLVSSRNVVNTREKLKPLFKDKIYEFNLVYKKYLDMRYYDVKELYERHQQNDDFKFIEQFLTQSNDKTTT